MAKWEWNHSACKKVCFSPERQKEKKESVSSPTSILVSTKKTPYLSILVANYFGNKFQMVLKKWLSHKTNSPQFHCMANNILAVVT